MWQRHALDEIEAALAPELLEIRQTAAAVHHSFAVDDCTIRIQLATRRCNGGKLLAPVPRA